MMAFATFVKPIEGVSWSFFKHFVFFVNCCLGEKYDVLLIDVSYNEHRPLMAPVEEFLAADEIAEMSKVLKASGMTCT